MILFDDTLKYTPPKDDDDDESDSKNQTSQIASD